MRRWCLCTLGLIGCLASAPPAAPVSPDRDGDGLPDARDLCPDAREDVNGFQDWDGCPEPDADHDGVLDAQDRCRNEAEDRDGFEDDDGCPDPDNDHDRIPDERDKCPNEPETYNAVDDEDGCPDKGLVRVGTPLSIHVPLRFAQNSARIDKEMEPFLDAEAAAVIDNSFITLLQIQGHASEEERHPQALGAARATAVRDALVARNVPSRRLTVKSFGATRPLCTMTAGQDCLPQNRRVDVFILEGEGLESKPPGDLRR